MMLRTSNASEAGSPPPASPNGAKDEFLLAAPPRPSKAGKLLPIRPEPVPI